MQAKRDAVAALERKPETAEEKAATQNIVIA